jgi:hypothetical protein
MRENSRRPFYPAGELSDVEMGPASSPIQKQAVDAVSDEAAPAAETRPVASTSDNARRMPPGPMGMRMQEDYGGTTSHFQPEKIVNARSFQNRINDISDRASQERFELSSSNRSLRTETPPLRGSKITQVHVEELIESNSSIPAAQVLRRLSKRFIGVKESSKQYMENRSLRWLVNFIFNPYSNTHAFLWNAFLVLFVIIDVIMICLQSCDGPNQYVGRPDAAQYQFLPDARTYFVVDVIITIPQMFDFVVRVSLFIVVWMTRNSGSSKLFSEMTSDPNYYATSCAYLFGLIPFIVNGIYLEKDISNEWIRILLRLLDLLNCLRVAVICADIPAIWALRRAIVLALPHLIAPIFFFFVINITGSVIIYFLEPCYDVATCPWEDLMQCFLFTVVSVSTVGYGNQVPVYEHTRLVIGSLILFGILFICMPLALLGNEYEKAWKMVSGKSGDIIREERMTTTIKKNTIDDYQSKNDEELRKATLKAKQGVLWSTYISSQESLRELIAECKERTKVTPGIIVMFVTLRGTIQILISQAEESIKSTLSTFKYTHGSSEDGNSSSKMASSLGSVSQGGNSNKRGAVLRREGSTSLVESKSANTDDVEIQDKSCLHLLRISLKKDTLDEQLARVRKQPNSWKSKLWYLLEMPTLSSTGRNLQGFFVTIILLSIFGFYTQTLQSLHTQSEGSPLCGRTTQAYCRDKVSSNDPGCFVHTPGPNNTAITTSEKLRFDCTDTDCFGSGVNWGSGFVTCGNYAKNGQTNAIPFESTDNLIQHYGVPSFMTSRNQFQRQSNLCLRIECQNNKAIMDGKLFWIPLEVLITFCFTIDLLLRLYISPSIISYIITFVNLCDIFSLLSFYVDFVEAGGNLWQMDFAIMSSSPDSILLTSLRALKVLRLFKLLRHFQSASVLWETVGKAGRQLLAMLTILVFAILLFAIIIFELEYGAGHVCYVGDADCVIPTSIQGQYNVGARVIFNKDGEISKFGNVLYSIWFTFVTLSSVGYGDIVPTTNTSQFITVFVILFGAMYMSMPLTAAASAFSSLHDLHESKREKMEKLEKGITDAHSTLIRRVIQNNLFKGLRELEGSFESACRRIKDPHNTENVRWKSDSESKQPSVKEQIDSVADEARSYFNVMHKSDLVLDLAAVHELAKEEADTHAHTEQFHSIFHS